MNFDLRLPIGLMFSLFGTVLSVYGLMSDAALNKKSLGLNINLDWGLVLLVFGGTMLFFALRARRRHGSNPPPAK